MPHIGLLINPHSQKSLRQPLLTQALIKRISDLSNIWQPSSLHQLKIAAQEIIKKRLDYLFICGGDGTFRVTIAELIRNRDETPLPVFIPLQGGTANLYSMQWYGRLHPIEHYETCVQKILSNDIKTKSVNILKINEEFGFIFAIGGISNFIHYYMSHPRRSITLGIWIAIKIVISALLKTKLSRGMFHSVEMEISMNKGIKQKISCTSLSCSTVPGYFLKPFVDIEINQKFSILLFEKFPWDLLFKIPSMIAQRRLGSPTISQSTASHLSIFLSASLPPMVDGDMLPPTHQIDVELGPEIKILDL